jgi:hypothetical protein
MGATNVGVETSADPFLGYPPQAVRCRWLSPAHEANASTAEIIRLVVDEARGSSSPPWANEVYNRRLVREIKEFVGPTKAVLVTPAGIIATSMDWITPDRNSLAPAVGVVQRCLDELDLGDSATEILLGVDGCLPGVALPLQTVVHLGAERSASLSNTAIKVYPSENGYLLGWLLCEDAGEMLPDLFQGHIAQTSAGTILVLVCHELVLFSGRSESNLSNGLGLAIRERYRKAATTDPRPRYIVVPTHWQDARTGGSFINAASELAAESEATVVMTMRAPRASLATVANRFAVQGPNAPRVITLLVEDTE